MQISRLGRITGPATILAVLILSVLLVLPFRADAQAPLLASFLHEVPADELVEGADAYGPIRDDLPVAPVLSDGETVGWAFINSDFVGSTGYSGRPIHVMIAVDSDAIIQGVKLVELSEPILVIGIAPARIEELTEGYSGFDLADEVETGGSMRVLPRISGATVTIRVIDDSILRSGLRVAFALELGGLRLPDQDGTARATIDADAEAAETWQALLDEGTVQRLSLNVGQVNEAFEDSEVEGAASRRLRGAPDDSYIDLYAALASVPGIGQRLLRDVDYDDMTGWLAEGEHAVLIGGEGPYSFLGTQHQTSGVFDRIELIQGDTTVRFNTREYERVGRIFVEGAPRLPEVGLFRIPAHVGFDPTEPWRLQLLVERRLGAIRRAYTSFDLAYELPGTFVIPPPQPEASGTSAEAEERAARTALWQGIWRDQSVEIAGLLAMLTVLTGVFFFQGFVTRSARFTFWFRMSFLTVTLVFLGWYGNAQLSVVNLMALVATLQSGFTWDTFLLDPLTFILWFSVAASLIFWGRGAYCGWLCPFGALQELTNRIARALKVPQLKVPWAVHERLWAVKYIIFLGLFGVTLASFSQAEQLTEVEPFKTAIVMKFDRAWPFVAYVLVLLGIGLFVERFFCRYLCPLGAALAIPARMRMFDWLKRYRECGNPCQTCASECMVQAIHPTGEINPNECHSCLNCQVLYQSKTMCPVVVRQLKRRQAVAGSAKSVAGALDRATAGASK